MTILISLLIFLHSELFLRLILSVFHHLRLLLFRHTILFIHTSSSFSSSSSFFSYTYDTHLPLLPLYHILLSPPCPLFHRVLFFPLPHSSFSSTTFPPFPLTSYPSYFSLSSYTSFSSSFSFSSSVS